MILNLFLQVCDVLTAVHTDGRQYSVVLKEEGSGTDIYLNKVLLERNLAVPDNIEQILEKLAPEPYKANNISEESDVEPEEREIVKLFDWEEEGYEFVMDDLQKFIGVSLPIL
jgi:hypothetical protein